MTKATRQRQLSALRKLAQMAYILTPTDDARRIVEALRVIKVPTSGTSGTERAKRALAPSEADKVLRVWNDPTSTHRRNQALIAVMVLGALRRCCAGDRKGSRRTRARRDDATRKRWTHGGRVRR